MGSTKNVENIFGASHEMGSTKIIWGVFETNFKHIKNKPYKQNMKKRDFIHKDCSTNPFIP